MAIYRCYHGPAWIVDVEAEDVESAIERARNVDPDTDTAELVRELKAG